MDFHDQVRFGYQEPDEPDPYCEVCPHENGTWGLYDADDASRIGTDEYPTRDAAIAAAEEMGWRPRLLAEDMEPEWQEPTDDDPPF